MKNAKSFRRIFSILLIAVMLCLSLCCCSGIGKDSLEIIENGVLQYPSENEEFEYNVYDTYVEITDYIGDDSEVTIPSTIEGLPVMVIADEAFCLYNSSPTFVLPDTIAVIGYRAFYGTWDSDSINLPDSVKKIGEEAFYGFSSSVTEISIPSGVESIGHYSFMPSHGYGTDIDIKIYSMDAEYDGQAFGWDSNIYGYTGSTTAAYCAEHDMTLNLLDD